MNFSKIFKFTFWSACFNASAFEVGLVGLVAFTGGFFSIGGTGFCGLTSPTSFSSFSSAKRSFIELNALSESLIAKKK